MKSLKVGIIGCGKIAQKAHIPAFKLIPGVDVYAVADINKNLLKKVARKYNIPHMFTDYKELLKEEVIDLVSICTPTPTHAKIALDAINAGKHVLVEKPLAINAKDAFEVVKAAKENNVKLCCVFNYRYFPAVRRAKKVIESGALGELVSVRGFTHTHFPVAWSRSTWFYYRGGVLYDFAPHLIDMLLWLCDVKPKSVYAVGGDFLKEAGFINYAQILIESDDKVILSADISWLTGTLMFLIDVHGTGGHLLLDVRYNHLTEFHGVPIPLDYVRDFKDRMISILHMFLQKTLFKGALAFYPQLIRDFVASIRMNRAPPISPERAAYVVAVLEAAEKSLTKREVIEINELIS